MSAPDNTREAWTIYVDDDDGRLGDPERGSVRAVRVVSLDAVLAFLHEHAGGSYETGSFLDAAEFLESVFGAEDPQP